MKIISKFHDYYDSALGYGIDPNCIFDRKTEVADVSEELIKRFINSVCEFDEYKYVKHYISNNRSYSTEIGVSSYLVGFCGKIYPVLILTDNNGMIAHSRDTYCYSLEQVDKFFEKNPQHKNAHDNYTNGKNGNMFGFRRNSFNRDTVKDFFDHYSGKEALRDVFDSIKAPYFLVSLCSSERDLSKTDTFARTPKFKKNPCLKDIDFYQAVDSYTAFQEISMYLSGVLGSNENNMVSISDKDKRDAKGFDNYSFKKQKTKNK